MSIVNDGGAILRRIDALDIYLICCYYLQDELKLIAAI